eukprot:3185724-Rhodomonas_salina.3
MPLAVGLRLAALHMRLYVWGNLTGSSRWSQLEGQTPSLPPPFRSTTPVFLGHPLPLRHALARSLTPPPGLRLGTPTGRQTLVGFGSKKTQHQGRCSSVSRPCCSCCDF